MAELTGAKMSVIHVVPGSVMHGDEPAVTEGPGIHRLREMYPAEGAEYVVLHGHEADKVIKFAAEKESAVIVIGSRGVGVIVGLFGGGSVCDKIVANATVPVLVVPAG